MKLVFISLCLLLMPFVWPVDPLAVRMEATFAAPSFAHWLGTDHLGRDVFARLLHGGQVTMSVALITLLLAIVVGVPLGMMSGFFGGRLDRFVMRCIDLLLTFPDFLIALFICGLLGPGLVNLVIALFIARWVTYARLTRSIVVQVAGKDYLTKARINGLTSWQIMRRHLLPHVWRETFAYATVDLGKVVLLVSSLSYLGLGAQPPYPEWGAMLKEATAYLYVAPHLLLYPSLAIIGAVYSFNRRTTDDSLS